MWASKLSNVGMPTFLDLTSRGRLAQLVRAAALHAVGLGFESLVAHFKQLGKPIRSK
jgi:hypothetical protein